MIRQVQITFDCADPGSLAEFWAAALGYRVQPPPAPFDSWDEALEAWGVPQSQRNSRAAIVPAEEADGPRIFFQQVPESKGAKNRVHLDVRAAPGLEGEERMAELEAECERLLALGATRARRFEPGEDPGGTGFIVMADPEGNEFCLD